MNNFTENIISGVIGGLVVYFFQVIREIIKEKKQKIESNKVGNQVSKYLDEKFLLNYEPGGLSIEKIIQDFGEPTEKYKYPYDSDDNEYLVIYKYKFVNAVVLFSTIENNSSIVSITVNSSKNKKHPVLCPYTFDEKEKHFGNARITSEIIENERCFEKESYTNWAYSAIQAKFFQREIKHFTFTYFVCDIGIENIDEMKGKVIDQICISTVMEVFPIINFYEMV
jgi:hypothetical protein